MCIGKAFIARKGRRWPDYLMDSNDHRPLVEKLNLADTKLVDRNFVRLEAHPLNCLTSTNTEDWEIVVDEVGTLPSWFEKKKRRLGIQMPQNLNRKNNTNMD